METTTINQLIETGGIIIGPTLAILVGYYFANKLIRIKSDVKREIGFLKGTMFLYEVILCYKDEVKKTNKTSLYITFRKNAEESLGYKPDDVFSPSSIRSRLAELGELSKKIDKTIEKVSKI